MDRPPSKEEELVERYRAGYLKLRSALHDRTTGLPAYPLLFDTLRGWLESRRQVGVVHVEIVNLDLVESLYGWQVFDRIVARAAALLRDAVGAELPAGTHLAICGVGEDRFVAFVPDTHEGKPVDARFLARTGQALAARLGAAFDVKEFAGLAPKLAFRAGHALLSENPFHRFERRVHGAVEQARTAAERRQSRREASHCADLQRIIEEAAVSTLFQPVVDLETGRILGFEALARGPKDTVFEMPSAMFALSSRAGVAMELDRLCRKSALRALGSFAGRGRGKIFLNVLPGSLADPDWRGGGVEALLEAQGLGPPELVVEVSEREADADLELVASCFESLKAQGFSLALDDVGTGYATVGTLERVPLDYLKMDMSLVHNIHENLIKQELLSSLVQIGRRIGAEVIALGIESDDETSVLRAAGARYGQGFLFAKPALLDSERGH